MKKNKFRILDFLFLGALIVFLFLGMNLVPLHGDEPMIITRSQDYQRVFLEGDITSVQAGKPLDIESERYFRMLEGTVNHFVVGFTRQIFGNKNKLPPFPGWDFAVDYQTNLKSGFVPNPTLLTLARICSTIFLAASLFCLFYISKLISSRPAAYISTFIYATNSVLILDGRRAMLESTVLFFGLLNILIAIFISKYNKYFNNKLFWLMFCISAGLALASKHTGLIFVLSSFAIIFTSRLKDKNLHIKTLIKKLVFSFLLITAIFIALSPHIWKDPAGGLIEIIKTRRNVMEIQVNKIFNGRALNFGQRLFLNFYEPFVAPLEELSGLKAAVKEEFAVYSRSPFSGIHSYLIGSLITLAAYCGLIWCITKKIKTQLVVWFLVIFVSLLANPVGFQRYYIPLIPVMSILAAVFWTAVMSKYIFKKI